MEPLVTRNPKVMHGAPCFAGTRVTVQTFFDHLEAGYTVAGFREQFPTVSRAQVTGLLATKREDWAFAESEPSIWPPPTFKVFSRDRKLMGYGATGGGLCEVYPPGGEDERYMGCVSSKEIRFPSEVVVGRVDDGAIFWDDGSQAGQVRGEEVFDSSGELAARVVGPATPEEAAGAAMLLVLIRWL